MKEYRMETTPMEDFIDFVVIPMITCIVIIAYLGVHYGYKENNTENVYINQIEEDNK